MSGLRATAAVAGLAVAAATLVGLVGEDAVAERQPPLWLALGDSYSSGEGIVEVDDTTEAGVRCQRANGVTDGRAWAVVAYDELWGAEARAERQAFTACTGAKSHDAMAQYQEAAEVLPSRPEVVSFSFGGNDIGFAPILEGCLHLPGNLTSPPGCDITPEELKDRILMLAGRKPIGDGYEGRIALPDLYDQIAEDVVAPNGHVIVLGYPQLFEEVERWPALNKYVWQACEFIDRTEIALLRAAGTALNAAIEESVRAADRRHTDVSFHFVDVAEVYENEDGRHGLCSEDPWLNGFPVCVPIFNQQEPCEQWNDPRIMRAYHPGQEGHTATGKALASYVRSEIPELLDGGGGKVGREPPAKGLLVPSDFEPAIVRGYPLQTDHPPVVGDAFPCKPSRNDPPQTWTDAGGRFFLGTAENVATAPDGSTTELDGSGGSSSTQQVVWTFATAREAESYLAGLRAVIDSCSPLGDLGVSAVTPWRSPVPGWTGFRHEYQVQVPGGSPGRIGASVYAQHERTVLRLTNDIPTRSDSEFVRSRVDQLAAIALPRLS